MPLSLGKRKRIDPAPQLNPHPRESSASASDESVDLQAIFRRHFEAKFTPLEELRGAAEKGEGTAREQDHSEDEDEDEDDHEDGSGWAGLEDDRADGQAVQVVEHTAVHRPDKTSKAEARAYMSSKPPPSESKAPTKSPKTLPTSEDEDKSDKLNLKHDLALQRLINESHLLDPGAAAAPGGRRQKILDTRLKALGSKSSILEQEKMPMSHRKGIVAKAKDKEARRRLEAKEAGVVLEKVARGKKSEEKRARGVTGPAVGKFKGGTLRLNRRDVADITGPKRSKRR